MRMYGHQEYLEAPYVDAARREEMFEAWCEREGREGTHKDWEDFDDFLEAQYDE